MILSKEMENPNAKASVLLIQYLLHLCFKKEHFAFCHENLEPQLTSPPKNKNTPTMSNLNSAYSNQLIVWIYYFSVIWYLHSHVQKAALFI